MSLEYKDGSSEQAADSTPYSRDTFRTLFTISSTVCVALNLITLCAATFASLYSVRLALRGDGEAVEKSVKSVRGEYKFVLFLFCLGIFAFFMSISLMGFYKFDVQDAVCMAIVGFLGMVSVGCLMKRAQNKFYLSKSLRYLSTKKLKEKPGNVSERGGNKRGSGKLDARRDLNNVNLTVEEGIPYARMQNGGSVRDLATNGSEREEGGERKRKSTRGSMFGKMFGGGGEAGEANKGGAGEDLDV